VTDRPLPPPRQPRAEPREIVELKQLKSVQPELTPAVDMQLELVEMLRRVQGRIPLPRIHPEAEWIAAQARASRPFVRFEDIPLEWSDFRLSLRQTADILYRHDALERADHEAILALTRDGNQLAPLVTEWYEATSKVAPNPPQLSETVSPNLGQVLLLSLRPFLARCAEALVPRIDLSLWHAGHCPICGWEPDFAVILPSAERRLVCGRCLAQWPFDPLACPFCDNHDRARITSFATRDGRYRVSGCDRCKRYLKAYDGRKTTRPVILAVDSIATLPLDAAAMQRGYSSG
jgi:hypothetical protein